jgi:DNA-binding NarL/FixJ family response regulator
MFHFPSDFATVSAETLPIVAGTLRPMLSNQSAHPSQSPIESPSPQGAMLKILLVDDHAIVRVGLKQMLADAFAQLEVTEVGTGQEALAKAQEASWDLVVLDINLPDTNGLDVLKKLKTLRTALPVVVLSFHPEEQYAVRALKSGASAYVTKDTAPQELATAIKTVLAGRQYVTPTLAERLEAMPLHAAGKPLHTLLSDRELQVLSMIGGGKSVTEIAVALDLSVKTVSTYRMRLLSKLQLKTTSALIRYALTHHL